MTKLLIAVPTFENIAPETFKSIYDLEKIPGWNFEFQFVKGYDCTVARNKIAKMAIDQGYDYVLMVDSDIILPSDTVVRFQELDQDIILGYYPRKDGKGFADIYRSGIGYHDDNRVSMEDLRTASVNRLSIKGGGFGCAFIKTSVFNELKFPYFSYVTYPDSAMLSEDLYFCTTARNRGFDIFVDARVRCRHIGRKIYE